MRKLTKLAAVALTSAALLIAESNAKSTSGKS